MSLKKFQILVLGFLFLGLAGGGVQADEKSYVYESIKVEIRVNQDSTFEVVEEQAYRLTGSFGYFFRDIELKDLDHLSEIQVFDSYGRELSQDEYELSYKGNRRHIQWNFDRRDFDNEIKSWTIKYKVNGGLGFYDDYDELYWNAIFADREVPVNEAEVMVYLPEAAQVDQVRLFIGQSGDKTNCQDYRIVDGQTVRFWGKDIQPGQFMTIVITWPKGIVSHPFLERNQIINWLALLIALALPVFVFVRSYRRWKKSGRDPKIDKTIIAQYEPPEDLTPAVVGILDDQRFDIREVTATMIDLAVKGYLKIKEEKKSFWKGQKYTFEKIKDSQDLKLFEQEVIQGIFEKGSVVSSKDLRNKFYRCLSKIKKALHQEAAKTGYLTGNIQEIRGKYQVVYIITMIVAFGGFLFSMVTLGNWIGFIGVWSLLISIGLFISGVIGLFFGYYMPALTKQGAEEKWKWLGFKEYLHTAERFRLGAETVGTFSKYLPYAIIFGVEKEWADRFADLKYQQPDWYTPAVMAGRPGSASEGISSFSGLTSSISSFTSSISKTFGSTPGGSGAGAGGGAGGGGGGGGGGAG